MPAPKERRSSSTRPAIIVIGITIACAVLWAFFGTLRRPKMASPISILSLSQNRSVVRTIHDYVQPHGYAVTGVLESDPFSAKDLALSLRVLEPRPQAVVIGRGYSEDEAAEAREVFTKYAEDVGLEKGTVIKITDKVFDEVGKEGIPSWVLKQLEQFFGK